MEKKKAPAVTLLAEFGISSLLLAAVSGGVMWLIPENFAALLLADAYLPLLCLYTLAAPLLFGCRIKEKRPALPVAHCLLLTLPVLVVTFLLYCVPTLQVAALRPVIDRIWHGSTPAIFGRPLLLTGLPAILFAALFLLTLLAAHPAPRQQRLGFFAAIRLLKWFWLCSAFCLIGLLLMRTDYIQNIDIIILLYGFFIVVYPILAPVFLGRELRKDCPLLSASQQALLSTVVFLTTLLIYWTTSGVWELVFQDSIQTPASFSHYFPSLLFTFLFFLCLSDRVPQGRPNFWKTLRPFWYYSVFLILTCVPEAIAGFLPITMFFFYLPLVLIFPLWLGYTAARAVPAQPSKKVVRFSLFTFGANLLVYGVPLYLQAGFNNPVDVVLSCFGVIISAGLFSFPFFISLRWLGPYLLRYFAQP